MQFTFIIVQREYLIIIILKRVQAFPTCHMPVLHSACSISRNEHVSSTGRNTCVCVGWFMFMFMYMYVYIYVYVYMYVYVYVCYHLWLYVCSFSCLYLCSYLCSYLCLFFCLFSFFSVCLYVRLCVSSHLCLCNYHVTIMLSLISCRILNRISLQCSYFY